MIKVDHFARDRKKEILVKKCSVLNDVYIVSENCNCIILSYLNTNHYIFVGERPYKCELCPYSSSQKTHLTRHMRTHSGW